MKYRKRLPYESVDALRKRAFEIRTETGCVHGHALEELAKRHGFGTWAALLADAKTKEEKANLAAIEQLKRDRHPRG